MRKGSRAKQLPSEESLRVGCTIRRRRLKRGMKLQQQLADKLEVSQATVSRMERGLVCFDQQDAEFLTTILGGRPGDYRALV